MIDENDPDWKNAFRKAVFSCESKIEDITPEELWETFVENETQDALDRLVSEGKIFVDEDGTYKPTKRP